MKKLIFPALFISFGAIAGYWAASDGDSNVSDSENYESLIVDLQHENAALKVQLAEIKKLDEQTLRQQSFIDSPELILQANPSNNKIDDSRTAPNSDQDTLLALEQKLALIDTEAFVRDISHHMEKVGYEEFIDKKEEEFSREIIDLTWAQAEEESIYDVFLRAPELADVALVSTECKSVQCRISLSVATAERSNEVVADLSRILAEDKGNIYHWVSYDSIKNVTDVYISTHSNSFNSDGSETAN